MNHHNHLERFASRGLKAQALVDGIINGGGHRPAATRDLPAGDAAGVAERGPGAGRRETAAPRSTGMLVRILSSTDTAWLKAVMNSQDYTIGIRTAAQRRLAKLFRKGARK